MLSEEQLLLIEQLSPMNIDARYPAVKQEIYNSLDEKICEKLLNDTEELFAWVKEKLID